MFTGLAEPSTAPLANPPVGLVICTLNVNDEGDLPSRAATQWAKMLADSFGPGSVRKVLQQLVNLQVNGVGASSGSVTRREGWRLTRRDGLASADIFSTGCVLTMQAYPGFETFIDDVRAIWDVFAEIVKPDLRTQLSLQYFNVLSDERATTTQYWADKVRPSLLGLGLEPGFSEVLTNQLSFLDFTLGQIAVRLRYAVQPDQALTDRVAFLFDSDVKDEEPQSFDISQSLEELRDMHRTALQILQGVILPEYYRTLLEG